MYAAVAVPAADVRLGDRFGDGTIVCGKHTRPDGRLAVAYTRKTWRSRKVRVFDPEEPVTVYRVHVSPAVAHIAPEPPLALWSLS